MYTSQQPEHLATDIAQNNLKQAGLQPQAEAVTTMVDATSTRVDAIMTYEQVLRELFNIMEELANTKLELDKLYDTKTILSDQKRMQSLRLKAGAYSKYSKLVEQLERDISTIPTVEQSQKNLESEIRELLTRLIVSLKITPLMLPSEYDTETIKIFFKRLTERLREEYLETDDPDPNIYKNAIETADRANIESGELTSSREELKKSLTMTERMKEATVKPLRIHISDSQEDALNPYRNSFNGQLQNNWVVILPSDSNEFHIGWGQNPSTYLYRGGNEQICRLANRIRKENGTCEIASANPDHVHGINGTLTMGGGIRISVSANENNRSATVTFLRRNYDCWDTPRYARQILGNHSNEIINTLRQELGVESVTIAFEDFDSKRAN
ncbi:MAG: hypothetical protein WCT46_00070 [Candidatus Gracilibacteria bacterium]|jgi:hypothetical protein